MPRWAEAIIGGALLVLLMAPLLHLALLRLLNARLHESLDQLTGLFNRRFIDEALRICLAEAVRRCAPYSVALIDIDHFKRFNDIYGHEAGDLVICTLGAHFARSLR